MRQRYLLGKYNLYKYKREIDVESALEPENFRIQSTDLYRTLQSGYSEVYGMQMEQNVPDLKISGDQLEQL